LNEKHPLTQGFRAERQIPRYLVGMNWNFDAAQNYSKYWQRGLRQKNFFLINEIRYFMNQRNTNY
jgi:hypothetical protein